MDIITQACDICAVQKKNANRWWKAYRLLDGVGVVVTAWDAEVPDIFTADSPAHLCGENHLFEWITKHITGVTP